MTHHQPHPDAVVYALEAPNGMIDHRNDSGSVAVTPSVDSDDMCRGMVCEWEPTK